MSLKHILEFDSGAFISSIYDTNHKIHLIKSHSSTHYDPKYLLLKL